MTAVLEIKGICKSFFGVQVLHDVTFALGQNEILGLCGENGSGKSTTMNIIGGVLPADNGSIVIRGQAYAPSTPNDARDQGIAFIHQELNLFENLSIEENFFVGNFPIISPFLPIIRKSVIRETAKESLLKVGLDISPATLIGSLSIGERQLVEIARALAAEAKIIILDEPTTSLAKTEVARLFELMQDLRDSGISMIYISHAIDDVLEICDRVVVLRDGAVTGGGITKYLSKSDIVSNMVGRNIDQYFPPRDTTPTSTIVMSAKNLSSHGLVDDISFDLFAGEVLGVSGLMGAGRSELANILFGLIPTDSGETWLHGDFLQPGITKRIEAGMAFLTEDRRSGGLLMESSVQENIILVALKKISSRYLGILNPQLTTEMSNKYSKTVQLKAGSLETLAKHLSGGNQQKLVLGKWLMQEPRVFILDEPTRGIDVGAKYEIYKLINELAAKGSGVLLISSEIEELMGMCDRILVMNRGEIVSEFSQDQFNDQNILEAAMTSRTDLRTQS